MIVKLNKYDNSWYNPGNFLKRILWYCSNIIFFNNQILFPSFLKRIILRIFGAKIGKNVIFMQNINIKYPWNLEIGDFSWIGEGVWIQSLGKIKIGKNVCISQFSSIITGSHNYKKNNFDLIVKDVVINDGVWIGAFAIVVPGVKCDVNSVLAVSSVATIDLKENSIYQGNPAIFKRKRI